jgi:hypothetical protein
MNEKGKEPMHMFSDNVNAEAGPSSMGSRMKNAGPSVQFTFPEKDAHLPFPVLTPNRAEKSDSQHVRYSSGDLGANFTTDEEDYKYFSSPDEPDSTPSSPELKPVRMSTTLPGFGATTRTVWDMPMRGSRDAPKTFKGHHSEVEYFIAHYDKLLVKYRVTDSFDQCECVLDYCSTDVQGFIRASELPNEKLD